MSCQPWEDKEVTDPGSDEITDPAPVSEVSPYWRLVIAHVAHIVLPSEPQQYLPQRTALD